MTLNVIFNIEEGFGIILCESFFFQNNKIDMEINNAYRETHLQFSTIFHLIFKKSMECAPLHFYSMHCISFHVLNVSVKF